MNELHALLVTAPAQLREELAGRKGTKLAQACSGLQPLGDLADPAQGTRYALCRLAHRWQEFTAEISDPGRPAERLGQTSSPGPAGDQGCRGRDRRPAAVHLR
jgi:transposase